MNIPGMVTGTVLAAMAISAVERVLPVVARMSAAETEIKGNDFLAHVTGYKIKDCSVVKDSFVGWQYDGNIWLETPFEFVADATPNDSKPDSWQPQDFGVWKWYGVSDDTEKVRLSLLHNCDGRLTITKVNFNL